MFDGAMPFIVNKRFTKKMNSNIVHVLRNLVQHDRSQPDAEVGRKRSIGYPFTVRVDKTDRPSFCLTIFRLNFP